MFFHICVRTTPINLYFHINTIGPRFDYDRSELVERIWCMKLWNVFCLFEWFKNHDYFLFCCSWWWWWLNNRSTFWYPHFMSSFSAIIAFPDDDVCQSRLRLRHCMCMFVLIKTTLNVCLSENQIQLTCRTVHHLSVREREREREREMLSDDNRWTWCFTPRITQVFEMMRMLIMNFFLWVNVTIWHFISFCYIFFSNQKTK